MYKRETNKKLRVTMPTSNSIKMMPSENLQWILIPCESLIRNQTFTQFGKKSV